MQTISINGLISFPVAVIPRLFILLSWLCVQLDAKAQTDEPPPFVLSERVGQELDSIEVEYFNVFPELDEVKSVVYRKDNLENVKMLVSMANGSDTTISFSKLAAEQLTIMIDRFEDLADSSDLVNWKLLPGYSQGKFNYFENSGRTVKVNTSEGIFTGRMLQISDTALLLYSKKGDFKPKDFGRYVKKIAPQTIKSIEIKPNLSSKLFGASFGAGLAVGALQLGYNVTGASNYILSTNSILLLGIGGLLGSVGGFFFDGISTIGRFKDVNQDFNKYLKVKESVRSKAMFNSVYPPELKTFR
ncbi:MAG TPA: hypothetical protein PK509_10120 [Catalimonadaceae bacterium]|nr:hypothetical protein [Catalimonadaceae bacterium]